MNLAVIGLGNIANYHLNAIRQIPSINLVGGFDIQGDPDNKLTGAKLFKTYEDVLSNREVDTILMLVPSQFKYELSLQAIRAGKNLITEKPATQTLEELRKLIEESKKNDIFIHGALHSRFSPTTTELKKLLSTNKYSLDKVQSIVIWAYSPHVQNGILIGKSSERTSFLAEGSNILAELLLYLPSVNIHIAKSEVLEEIGIEVETIFSASSNGIRIAGATSWTRNKKEKGVIITFKDGRELTAIHTEQKIYDENERVIFDGSLVSPEISRMQKEYNALYCALVFKDQKIDNTKLLLEIEKSSADVKALFNMETLEWGID